MLVERQDIAKFCEILRKGGQKVVFTNGCFDILHAGHVTYLEDNKLSLTYNKAKAVTPGQFCVLYKDDICLGGGIIDEVSK